MARKYPQLPEMEETYKSDRLSWLMIGIGLTLCYLVLAVATGGIVYAAYHPNAGSTDSTLFTKLSDMIEFGASHLLNKTKPNKPLIVENINWTKELYEKVDWKCPDKKGSCVMDTLKVDKCIDLEPRRKQNQTCIPQPKEPCISQPWPEEVTTCRPVTPRFPERREYCCSNATCYEPSKPDDSLVIKTCEYPMCPPVEPAKFTIEDFRNSPFLDTHTWVYWLKKFEKYSLERLEVVTTLMEKTVEELNRASMSHRCDSHALKGYDYRFDSCEICKNRYDYIECVMNNDFQNIEPKIKVELFSPEKLKSFERKVAKVVYGPGKEDLNELNPFFDAFEALQEASKVVTTNPNAGTLGTCTLCEYNKRDVNERNHIFKRCFSQSGSKPPQ